MDIMPYLKILQTSDLSPYIKCQLQAYSCLFSPQYNSHDTAYGYYALFQNTSREVTSVHTDLMLWHKLRHKAPYIIASMASGRHLDTHTFKNHPSGHTFFVMNFFKMSISSIPLIFSPQYYVQYIAYEYCALFHKLNNAKWLLL